MKIIAFGHRRWVGKDTCAKFALSYARLSLPGVQSIRFGFADSVKDLAYQMYGWTGLQPGIYYDNHPEYKEMVLPTIGKSPRDIWIELGEAGRKISRITWAELGFYRKAFDLAFISDLRDPAEAEYIKSANGYIVKIQRPGTQEFGDSADSALADCNSWDGIIMNDCSMRDLNTKVKIAVDKLLGHETGWTL